MSKAKKASAPIGAKTSWKNAFKRDWQLYLMLLFPLAMVIENDLHGLQTGEGVQRKRMGRHEDNSEGI